MNTSVSARGVVRGIHFAEVPLGQAKYVTVAHGAIVDYVVDLRLGSPNLRAGGTRPSSPSTTATAVFMPEGFGHAFVALTDDTVVSLPRDRSVPSRARARWCTPLDEEIALEFPLPADDLRLSPKDPAASAG